MRALVLVAVVFVASCASTPYDEERYHCVTPAERAFLFFWPLLQCEDKEDTEEEGQ